MLQVLDSPPVDLCKMAVGVAQQMVQQELGRDIKPKALQGLLDLVGKRLAQAAGVDLLKVGILNGGELVEALQGAQERGEPVLVLTGDACMRGGV